MNSDDQTQPTEQPLQFDTAEYAAPAPVATCAFCTAVIGSHYWEIAGKVACESCRTLAQTSLTGGSRILRFLRALVLGLLAAAAGSALWWGVRAVSGYELGLIALAVGLLVGGAVRVGCRRRGGWLYQIMAIFLTYSAVVANYLPTAITQWSDQAAASNPDAVNAGARDSSHAQTAAASTGQEEQRWNWRELSTLGKVFMAVFLFAVMFVLWIPTLISSGEFIGLLILAFALYEAWKMNRKLKLAINGPFEVAPAAAAVTLGADAAPGLPMCDQTPEPMPDQLPAEEGDFGRG